MVTEALKPEQLGDKLKQRLTKLQKILAAKESQIKKFPEGHLRIAQRHGKCQYYHYTEAESPKGRYIPQKKTSLVHSLAQKDYDTQIIRILKKEVAILQTYLKQTSNGNEIKSFYEGLCPARQRLITPITLTDEQYISQWKNVAWTGHPFSQDAHIFYTARNERVRSKSEVLIADALTRHGIVYRYEYPVQLHHSSNSGTPVKFYPDFLCLNVRTRVEFYWEHFGRMDNTEYSNNATAKLRLYTENGIIAGRNLIITMETQTEPLSTRVLEKIIAEFLT